MSTPGATFVVVVTCLVALTTLLMFFYKVLIWWDGRAMSSESEPRNTSVRSPVYVPVSSMPYQEDGIPDIDAELQADRDITGDAVWIERMARAPGKGKQYQFSANQIHAAIGGDRNAVLAKVREIRATPPRPEYMQPDGSRVPATHPVTGQRHPA